MITKIVVMLIAIIYALIVMSFFIVLAIERLPKLIEDTIKEMKTVTFKGIMSSVGIYHLVIFVLATTDRHNNYGKTDLLDYQVLAFPIYIAIGIYILKPISIYIDDMREERREKRAAEEAARFQRELDKQTQNRTFQKK